jgi:hypothetical protein
MGAQLSTACPVKVIAGLGAHEVGGEAKMTPMPEISVARTQRTAELEAFKSRLLAYCNEAATLLLERIQIRQKLNGQEILQVTRAQCRACGARSVFSVLVAESTGACGRDGGRAFYTCDRTLLTKHYVRHNCEREAALEAA